MSTNSWYFAFGSNMDKQRIKNRLKDIPILDELIVEAPNYILTFDKIKNLEDKSGYANIRPKESSVIYGVGYLQPKEGFDILDKYEGYPYHYTREKVMTNAISKNNQDQKFEMIAYIGNEDNCSTTCRLKPTRDYLNHLLQRKSDQPEHYQSMLEKIQVCDSVESKL